MKTKVLLRGMVPFDSHRDFSPMKRTLPKQLKGFSQSRNTKRPAPERDTKLTRTEYSFTFSYGKNQSLFG